MQSFEKYFWVIPVIIFIIGREIRDYYKKQKLKNEKSNNTPSILNQNTDEFETKKSTHSIIIEDKISKIEKLGKLKEQGLLTEEEFQKEKEKILV